MEELLIYKKCDYESNGYGREISWREELFLLYEVESEGCSVLGTGSSAMAAMDDILKGREDMKACLASEGRDIPELEIEYVFDIGSLFSYYDFLNLLGVSRELGLNPSVGFSMRQVSGNRARSARGKSRTVSKDLHERFRTSICSDYVSQHNTKELQAACVMRHGCLSLDLY